MSKYAPLPKYLSGQKKPELRLGFREIETILGFPLPKSAYAHEAWWSNNATGHSHARTWMSAGWRTAAIDLASRKVTFARAPGKKPKSDPFGCMAGTITFLPGVDLTAPTETNWNAELGRLLNE